MPKFGTLVLGFESAHIEKNVMEFVWLLHTRFFNKNNFNFLRKNAVMLHLDFLTETLFFSEKQDEICQKRNT